MTVTTHTHSSHWGAFVAEVADGRLVGVRPFEHDPAPSPILDNILDGLYAATRVKAPAVRRGWLEHGPGATGERRGVDPFVEVSWDEALDLVAGELRRVIAEHGNAAIFGGSYGWASAGRFHHAKTQLRRFLNCCGGCTAQVQNYSYAAAITLLPHVIGTYAAASGLTTSWSAIVEHTRRWVMFGGLPPRSVQIEAGGVGAHVVPGWLGRVREAGVKCVNVSPARDDVSDALGAEWLPIRPGTDTALMLGLAHTLLAEGLHDERFLRRCCVGFERLARYLQGADDGQPKDADWAAGICGIAAETIRAHARAMAAERTLVTVTWSLQRADHGEQPYWMAIALAAMLGQIGLPGGGFGFGYGSSSGIGTTRLPFAVPVLDELANPVDTAIPVARLTDMLLSPGAPYEYDGRTRRYPDVRLVYWAGGNPFHHHQDLNRLVRAWARPETIIVHEPWWTATARRADIVLPATTTLERNDLGVSSRDRYIIAMRRAVDPVDEARDDFAIFSALAARLGLEERFAEGRDEMGWLRHLYERSRASAAAAGIELSSFDELWERGYERLPEPPPLVLFERFRADPDGAPLATPSGRIELFSETIASFGYDDCPGHPAWLEPAEWLGGPAARRHPLHLLSHQPARRLHSQLDMGRTSRAGKRAGREPCRINSADARRREISDGDVVRVFNDRGSCLATAELTDDLREGVCQLATGAWLDPLDPATAGSMDVHGNPNVLTADRPTSRLAQGPSSHSTLVEIERYDGPLPPVSVFCPPAIVRKEPTHD